MGPGRDLGSLEYDQVGLPEALEADIRAWAHSFEQTLDHTYPPLSGWSDRESYDRFIATAHDLYTRLQVVADERGWKLSMSLPEYYQRGVLPVRHDWRRQGQERYLRDLSFTLLEWSSARPGWDHDHCEFCNAKFSNAGGTWRVGYATEDRYRWICPTCYADFWREFGWAPPAT